MMVAKIKERAPYFFAVLYIAATHQRSFRRLFGIDWSSEFSKIEFYSDILAGGIFCLSFCALVWQKLLLKKEYWFCMVALLLIEQYNMRLYALNSSYLYKYFMVALFLSFREKDLKDQRAFLGKSARMLLFVALFFAALQKLFSEHYREGNLIVAMIYYKGLVHFLLRKFDPSFGVELQQYHAVVYDAINKVPLRGLLEVSIAPKVIWIALIMSIGSIVLEFVLACLCLTKKTYESWITFILSVGLVLGIYTLAEETYFLGLVCLLSYYAHECSGRKALFYLMCCLYFLAANWLNYTPLFLELYDSHQ